MIMPLVEFAKDYGSSKDVPTTKDARVLASTIVIAVMITIISMMYYYIRPITEKEQEIVNFLSSQNYVYKAEAEKRAADGLIIKTEYRQLFRYVRPN